MVFVNGSQAGRRGINGRRNDNQPVQSGLLLWYDMIDGRDTTIVVDIVGGYDGTLVNADLPTA